MTWAIIIVFTTVVKLETAISTLLPFLPELTERTGHTVDTRLEGRGQRPESQAHLACLSSACSWWQYA